MTKTTHCLACNAERPYVRPAFSLRGWVCMVCRNPVELRQKFGNKITQSKHTGRVFQSRMEANREPVLLALQNAGQITGLVYQVRHRLEVFATGSVEGLLARIEEMGGIPESVVELARIVRRSRHHVCDYISDFEYVDWAGRLVVEDVKGFAKPEYRIKKKLMVPCCDIEIAEPNRGGVQQRARGAGIAGRGTGSRLRGNRLRDEGAGRGK